MTKLAFVFFSFFMTFFMSAQQSSQFLAHWHSSNPTGNVTLGHSYQGPSGEFVFAGEYTNGVQFGSNINSNPAHNNYLMKVDANGAHQWTVTFGNKDYMFIEHLAVADDGSIFISGNFKDSISVQNYSRKEAGFQPFMWKISPSGNFDFAFDFRSNPTKIARPRFSVQNGEVTVTVMAQDSLNYGASTIYPQRSSTAIGLFARYDYQGNLLYSETFDSPDYFFLLKPERLASNRVLVQVLADDSDSLYFGSSYFTGNNKKGTWFFELDSTFQVVKNHFIEYTGVAGFNFKGLSSTNELMYTGTFSGTITDGSLSVQNLNSSNPLSLSDGVFMVMSPNLDPVLLESTGVEDDNDNLTGVVELGGHYFLSGSAGGDLLYRGDTIMKTTTAQGFVLEMDKNGVQKSLIHTTNPSMLAQTDFSDIFAVNKTTYAVCGTATVSSVFNGTDTLDRQSFRDGFIWSFSDSRLSLKENNIVTGSIFPNPATDVIHLHTKEENASPWQVEMYDLNGKLVLSIQTSQPSINISTLKRGLYILEASDNSGKRTIRQKLLIK